MHILSEAWQALVGCRLTPGHGLGWADRSNIASNYWSRFASYPTPLFSLGFLAEQPAAQHCGRARNRAEREEGIGCMGG